MWQGSRSQNHSADGGQRLPGRGTVSWIQHRLLVAALGLSASAFSRAASADVTYSVTDLGVLPTTPAPPDPRSYTVPTAISDNGFVTGYAGTTVGSQPFFWSPAKGIQDLGAYPSLNGRQPFSAFGAGVNDSGQVVGNLDYGSANPSAGGYIWSATTGMQLIDGGNFGPPAGINNAGVVVGGASGRVGVWTAAGGPKLFPSGGYSGSTPSGINSSGEVVGTGYGNVTSALLWSPSGSLTDVGSAITGGNLNSRASGINDNGQVIGQVSDATTKQPQAFLWTSGAPVQYLGDLSGANNSSALGVNNTGQVVGTSGGRPFIWTSAGGIRDLNTMLGSSGAGWTLGQPNAINNALQIVGEGVYNGVNRPFLLNPHLVMTATFQTPNISLTSTPERNLGSLYGYDPSNGTFDLQNPSTSFIKPGSPTIILTHGFTDNANTWLATAHAINLKDRTTNILAWDWSSNAAGSPLDLGSLNRATYRTQPEGRALGLAVSQLLGANYAQSVHFIGHSLGTLVNAQAINTLLLADPLFKIHDTLLDDAEAANVASHLVPIPLPTNFSSMPTAGDGIPIDNYISAVGNLHSQSVNVILSQGPTTRNPLNFHGYPIQWYQNTINDPSTSLLGLGYQFDGTQAQAGTPPFNFLQPGVPAPEYSLNATTYAGAETQLGNRNAAELVTAAPSAIEDVTVDLIRGVIRYVGNVTTNIAPLPRNALINETTPAYGPQFIIGKQSPSANPNSINSPASLPSTLMASKSLAFRPRTLVSNNSTTSSLSSYVWVPVSIPVDAQTISFDYSFSGLSPTDFLSAGINDTPLFSIQTEFVGDGVVNNTGMLDVSAWSGQNADIFLGLIAGDASNLNGIVTVDNIQFQGVPEPSAATGVGVTAACIASLRRHRRSRLVSSERRPSSEI